MLPVVVEPRLPVGTGRSRFVAVPAAIHLSQVAVGLNKPVGKRLSHLEN